MTLDVNEEELTILGIPFDNFSDFDTVWYAIGSSMIENYEPTVQDVIDLKTYIINKGLNHNRETKSFWNLTFQKLFSCHKMTATIIIQYILSLFIKIIND